MNKPHIHAEVIKAWADGAEIEWYSYPLKQWIPVQSTCPSWDEHERYRVKPKRHIHQDLMDAYAAGAKIQRLYIFGRMEQSKYIPEWRDDYNPKWLENVEYRIKPNPIVVQRAVTLNKDGTNYYVLDWAKHFRKPCNIEYTFNPDTKELLDVKKI